MRGRGKDGALWRGVNGYLVGGLCYQRVDCYLSFLGGDGLVGREIDHCTIVCLLELDYL